MAELRAIVGPEPSFELLKTAPPAETTIDTPLYDLMKLKLEAGDPGARAIPWMIPGATDNKFTAQTRDDVTASMPVKLDLSAVRVAVSTWLTGGCRSRDFTGG